MKLLRLLTPILFLANTTLAQEALPSRAPAPEDNPITDEKTLLGKTLYFDPRLSKNGTVSCNSCHNVMLGGEDNRPTSAGVDGKLGGRNSPTVWNSAFLSVQFWDGRAASLEEQAKGPLVNPVEMAMGNHDLVISRIQNIPDYQKLFDKAFGADTKITIDHVAKAIATYERTLITPNARFDKYLQGNQNTLTEDELKGYKLAQSVGCFACHSGPNLAGPKLPIGTGFYMKFPTYTDNLYVKKYKLTLDKGRYDVTKSSADMNVWRVPTLRNVALTAPYFHNGSVSTLDEAVRVMAKTQLNKDLTTEEVKSLVHFLNSLTGEFPEQSLPRLPMTSGTTLIKK